MFFDLFLTLWESQGNTRPPVSLYLFELYRFDFLKSLILLTMSIIAEQIEFFFLGAI